MPLFRRTAPPDPRVAQLQAEMAALQGRLAELEGRLSAADARLSAADARLDEVSSALTSQLHELSGELEMSHRAVDQRVNALDSLTAGRLAAAEKAQEERLATFRSELEALMAEHAAAGANGDAAADGAADDELTARLGELLERQTRIANEVARHEIAFQQELAALADRLGRQPPRR
jgi:chromosome segregation ATPase